MKKCVKVLGILVTIFVSTMIFSSNIKAASATISVRSNSSAVVGNNVTVTVTVSSAAPLGSWDFTIGYDTSLLRLISSTTESGGQRSAGYAANANQTSKSYTMVFKTLKSGNARVYVQSAEVYSFSDTQTPISVTKGSKSISLKTQSEIEASYSKNNNLSSLSVDGYQISPAFNKDTLEYSLDVDSSVEKVKVNATKEDSKANLTGGGEISLNEGSNQVKIVVTAENGNSKTYILNINVKEVNPIIVELNDKKYTVVKRKASLTVPQNFTETTVTINNEEVPAFYNEITKYTIVGLKDEAGNVGLYLYDLDSGKYTFYQELGFTSNRLFILEASNIPNGLSKTTIKINDEEVTAYKFDENSIYYIIYGMNLNTGNKDFYMYDSEEQTIQRYDTTMLDKLTKEKDKYFSLVLVLSSVCFLTMLFLLIQVNRSNKIKKDV